MKTEAPVTIDFVGNQLLARLPKSQYQGLFRQLTSVILKNGLVLHEARAPIDYAYFPNSGTLSAIAVLSDGKMIEVATIGNEGAVGLPTLAKDSPNRVVVQMPGEALRIASDVLERAIEQPGPLKHLLLKYQAAMLFQMSQSVACNGTHLLPARCCRWLLMSHDRVAGDVLYLTHEFLAAMLGVRRPGVTEVLQLLKDRNLIDYARGKISIKDRQGLEEGSCECYRLVRDEYARLLDGPRR